MISLRTYNREIGSLIDQENTDEAVDHCKYILKIFPKHLETYRLLGKAYLENRLYHEASDILRRVLNVVPDDLLAQIGMSIIHEDQEDFDAAIWHMERAFEVQPSNPTIQDELKRLHNQRDGITPTKILLTRATLVRMYARGELFTQAIAEAQAALNEDPNRIDIEVLLARAFFLSGDKPSAIEVSFRIISKLPFCYEANKILIELLPATSHSDICSKCRENIVAIDPYSAYISANASTSAQVPDNAIIIEKFEWQSPQMEDPLQQPNQAPGNQIFQSGDPVFQEDLIIDDILPFSEDISLQSDKPHPIAADPEMGRIAIGQFETKMDPSATAVIQPDEDSPLLPASLKEFSQLDEFSEDVMTDWIQAISPDQEKDHLNITENSGEEIAPSKLPGQPSDNSVALSWFGSLASHQDVDPSLPQVVPQEFDQQQTGLILEGLIEGTEDIHLSTNINLDKSPPSEAQDYNNPILTMQHDPSITDQAFEEDFLVPDLSTHVKLDESPSCEAQDFDNPISTVQHDPAMTDQASEEPIPGWAGTLDPINNPSDTGSPLEYSILKEPPESKFEEMVGANETNNHNLDERDERDEGQALPKWLNGILLDSDCDRKWIPTPINSSTIGEGDCFAPGNMDQSPLQEDLEPARDLFVKESIQPSEMNPEIPCAFAENHINTIPNSDLDLDDEAQGFPSLPNNFQPKNLDETFSISAIPNNPENLETPAETQSPLDDPLFPEIISPAAENGMPFAGSPHGQPLPAVPGISCPPENLTDLFAPSGKFTGADPSVDNTQDHEANETGSDHPDLLEQALDSLKRKDFSTALEKYTLLIQAGHSLEQIIVDINDALISEPGNSNLWLVLGDAHAKASHLQEAQKAYAKAEELLL
jgi:tetratricopeptide (TPR) repeat protein